MKTYDLIVIGGGRASLVAAEVARAGMRVALVEVDRLGGTCPNRGCVPSKLLIGHSDLLYTLRRAGEFGVKLSLEDIDRRKIFADNKRWIDKVDGRYEGRLKDSLDIYRGRGRFVDNYTVEVGGEQLRAERIVIGTGSRSNLPPEFGIGGEIPIWTSENIFPLEDVNFSSIAIVGGGVIACELASFFHAVGIDTHVVVRGQALLKQEDEEIRGIFEEEFSENVNVLYGRTVGSISSRDNGFVMSLEGGEQENLTLDVDRVLYATGRRPNADDLGIENTDIETSSRGYVVVDENLQTAVNGVYAVGDVAGNYMLQHSASFEARYLSDVILGKKSDPINYGMMPHAVYAEPEIAGVGMTQAQLEEAGEEFYSVTENFKASARALGMKIEVAAIKLVFAPDGRVLGCHIVGPQASTLIHQVLTTISYQGTVYDIARMIHIHPALSEVVLNAAEKAVEVLESRSN